MLKKSLSLLLSVLMVITVFFSLPFTANADEASHPDGLIVARDEFGAWGVDGYDYENDLGDVCWFMGENYEQDWYEHVESYKGISYDAKTNTLTLNSVKQVLNAFFFEIAGMGDLKVKLIGDSALVRLDIRNTNVTFTGNGSLTLNPPMNWTRDIGTEWEEIHENERIMSNALFVEDGSVHVDSTASFTSENEDYSEEQTAEFMFYEPKTTQELNNSVFTYDGKVASAIEWETYEDYVEPYDEPVYDYELPYVYHQFPASKILVRTDSVDVNQVSDYWIVSRVDCWGDTDYTVRPLMFDGASSGNMWYEDNNHNGFRCSNGQYYTIDKEYGWYNTEPTAGISFEPIADTSTLPTTLATDGVATALLCKAYPGSSEHVFIKNGENYVLHSTSYSSYAGLDYYNAINEPIVPAEPTYTGYGADMFKVESAGDVKYLVFVENIYEGYNLEASREAAAAKGYEPQYIHHDGYSIYYYRIMNNPLKVIATGTQAKNGWAQENGKWLYYKDDVAQTGWQKISKKWYYFNADGIMQTGWQKLSGKWYYFNSSGVMLTGWQKISKKWYYFNSSGVMLTKWQKISNKWYYLGTDGVMTTKWQKIDKKWYYFGTDGIMVTKWQKISNKWYYFGTDGVMVTKWQKISNKWYYFGTDGIMLANCSKKIGSKTYKFDKNGVCLNP